MLNLKSISETLSLLTGAALLAACGSSQAPVNSSEVPAEPDAKQAATATTETTSDDAASAATPAEPCRSKNAACSSSNRSMTAGPDAVRA